MASACASGDRVEDGHGGSGGNQVADLALREQLFSQFYDSTDFLEILRIFQSLCSEVGVDQAQYDEFYSSLKEKLTSWKAGALWQLLDARARLPEYENQRACAGKRVLVVGAGPVGLRAAIEAALLGASVDLVEKRDGFTRNNSLHLWPFLITDLRNLGAKKFYGKFASGSIDHICIRILQSILLKVCLLLGVKVHPGVTFTGLVEPKNANTGWSITTNPASCPASSYHYDIILAADGKQNSLPGFRTKEFRARLALAITANFVNHNTKQESSVPEISGIAYVYRQDFFNSMAKELGIELENIVYYKDETHYFVMTAKKTSLLKKGVIKKDETDPKRLLAPANLDRKALERYAIEATNYATEGALGSVEFEKNHRGENDVALFDFTSLFASENAARIIERKGKRILLCVAGDSLLEPFWPTGSGCARGFLGAFDAAWMMKRFSSGEADPIALLEEREAILYLLPQTTPERLQKNLTGYTINPKTRYTSLSELVPPGDVTHLFDSDDPNVVNAMKSRVMQSRMSIKETVLPTIQEEACKPKRSRSTEGLASKSQSTESPFEVSAKESGESGVAKAAAPSFTTVLEESGDHEHSTRKVRHFWQKERGDKATAGAAKSGESKEGGKKDAKRKKVPPSSSKPPLPSSAKEKSSTTGAAGSSPLTSQRAAKVTGKKSAEVSPSVKKAKFSPPASPDLHGDSKKKKKHSLFGGKGRSRSESPERLPKSNNKTSTKDSGSVAGHPLETATSVKSLDRESGGAMENKGMSAATNVLDMIKQYDKKDEVAKSRSSAMAGRDKTASTPSAVTQQGIMAKGKSADSSEKGAIGGKGGKGQKEKEKEKDKRSKDDRKKEGKETSSSSKGLFSFFKRGKGHDEEESGGTKQQKKKAKKDKEKDNKQTSKDSKTAEKEPELRPLTIKGRIERLKESGVYTDGSDDMDSAAVVLVSVTKHNEEEEEGGGQMYPPPQGEEEETREAPGTEREGETVEKGGETEIGETNLVGDEELEVFKSNDEEKEEVEGKEDETSDGVDRVKRLQSIFQAQVPERSPMLGRSLSTSQANRSKEIDLSDLLRDTQTKEEASHPLWLARIIQSLNKCLERLRKENDVLVSKTALVILNTIISNVQSHPDDDVYRRVRVSSDRFHTKVWQYSQARQFLARAGWVEIDDFIVLPIDSKVDIPKRILDKHLNIVNQMLWSMQLELPDSPGVLKRRPPRERSLTVMKRSSYATLIVEESLEQIEEDKRAMAAAAVSKRKGSESSPSLVRLQGAEKQTADVDKEGTIPEDYLDSLFVPASRTEEAQTMRAASAARSIWLQREVKKEETIQERKYRLILETELYDLPPPPTSVPPAIAASTEQSMTARSRSKSPEDEPISFTIGGGVVRGGELPSANKLEGLTPHDKQASKLSQVESLVEVPEDENVDGGGMKNGNGTIESESTITIVEDRLKKLTVKKSTSLSQQLGSSQPAAGLTNVQKEVATIVNNEQEDKNSDDRQPPLSLVADDDNVAALLPSVLQKEGDIREASSTIPTVTTSSSVTSQKKLKDSASGDQLRQLLLSGGGQRSTSPGLLMTETSPSTIGNGVVEEMRDRKSPSPVAWTLEEPQKSKADAQHPTESAIKSGRLEYERLAIQAAAETRQKWKETEASSSNKEELERTYL